MSAPRADSQNPFKSGKYRRIDANCRGEQHKSKTAECSFDRFCESASHKESAGRRRVIKRHDLKFQISNLRSEIRKFHTCSINLPLLPSRKSNQTRPITQKMSEKPAFVCFIIAGAGKIRPARDAENWALQEQQFSAQARLRLAE